MTEFNGDRVSRTGDSPTRTTLTYGEITYVVKGGNLYYLPAGCLIALCPPKEEQNCSIDGPTINGRPSSSLAPLARTGWIAYYSRHINEVVVGLVAISLSSAF